MLKFAAIYLIIGVFIAWLSLEAGEFDAQQRGLTYTQAHDQTMKEINQKIGADKHHSYRSSSPVIVLMCVVLLWVFIVPVSIVSYIKKR